jgi:rhamnose utilization protein RhaD (predicted bifunctional aldolase and dehydrogenase)
VGEDAVLDDLILLSYELGEEASQFTFLGEGNLSVDCGDGTFWVKTSGNNIATIHHSSFSRVLYEVVRDSLVDENRRQSSGETF